MPPRTDSQSKTGNLMVNIFDGGRKPISSTIPLLIRLIDGNQHQWSARFHKGPSVAFRRVPVFENLRDNYTVLVSAKDHVQAGFTPIRLLKGAWRNVDLMLLRADAGFNFAEASWEKLQQNEPVLSRVLAQSAPSEVEAEQRYDDLMENHSASLAALLNISTAMRQINLPVGTPLEYLETLDWSALTEDRVFGYARETLIDQIELSTEAGLFIRQVGSGFFHSGANRSYKQVQFGEANLQFTFHEGDKKRRGGSRWVKLEVDMDYFRDPAGHALLEVVPNTISGRLTDPRQVYVLRWIAGRHAGVPEFNPPYTVI